MPLHCWLTFGTLWFPDIFVIFYSVKLYCFYNKQKLFSNSGPEFQDEDALMISLKKKMVHIGNIVLVYIPLPLGETLIFCQGLCLCRIKILVQSSIESWTLLYDILKEFPEEAWQFFFLNYFKPDKLGLVPNTLEISHGYEDLWISNLKL